MAYFTTGRANNGGGEAVNGIVELHRFIAAATASHGSCCLRVLQTAAGLLP